MIWGEFTSLSGRQLRGGLRQVHEFTSGAAFYLQRMFQLAAAVLAGRILMPLIFKLAVRN
jgi:hypothetical protein